MNVTTPFIRATFFTHLRGFSLSYCLTRQIHKSSFNSNGNKDTTEKEYIDNTEKEANSGRIIYGIFQTREIYKSAGLHGRNFFFGKKGSIRTFYDLLEDAEEEPSKLRLSYKEMNKIFSIRWELETYGIDLRKLLDDYNSNRYRRNILAHPDPKTVFEEALEDIPKLGDMNRSLEGAKLFFETIKKCTSY